MNARTLGSMLRRASLHPRALAAWAGTDRISSLPEIVPALAGRDATPAGATLALLVAGADVPLDRLGARQVDALHELDLIEIAGGRARARVAVLPIGEGLLVCDRLDAPADPDLVCWPDDSSYHLAHSLPPFRRDRWIDLGCGSAFAALARPGLATSIAGTDLNPRATRYARLGAALSGIDHVEIVDAAVGSGQPASWRGCCQLVSCNAPIPEAGDDPYRPRWRATDDAFLACLTEEADAFLAGSGTIVIHAALPALAPIMADLPGERVVVAYTPEDHAGFAIAWWTPQAERRHVTARRALTPQWPHLGYEDRAAALAGPMA